MSDYENDHFEAEEESKKHLLRLGVDILSVKDLKVSANVSIEYVINLDESHAFKSSPPTPVNQGQEAKIGNSFASYEFQANKSQLQVLLTDVSLAIKLIHQDKLGNGSEVGQAIVQMKDILSAPLKNSAEAAVRVCDQYLPIKDSFNQLKGMMRCILYLEDLGEVKVQNNSSQKRVGSNGRAQENRAPNSQQDQDYQTVWQLEIWKRAEEQKFKAYLKQKEIERIEEITFTWKGKEQEREKTFNESLNKITKLEQDIRAKALMLQSREQKIIVLEEELKHKINEVAKSLSNKEEEVVNVKKRFKEERTLLEQDKKKLLAQNEELKGRVENAEQTYYKYKKEVDESPLTVLRTELGQKNLEIIELDSKLKQANEQKEEYKKMFEKVKKDMVAMKKQKDQERELKLTQQAEELETTKMTLREKQIQDEERREITALKLQMATLQSKLSETQNINQNSNIPQTINDRAGTYNPFYQQQIMGTNGTQMQSIQGKNPFQTQSNVFLDNFASKQQSPKKQSYNGVSMTSEIDRLMKERADLLATGCYTTDDPLIMELDRQIKGSQMRITQH